MLDARFQAGAGHVLGRQDVVAHSFAQLPFQHRYMLVRCGMERGVDRMQRQRMADHRRIATVAQHRFDLDIGEAATQLTLDGQQQQFADLQQDDAAGTVARALAAQLRTDRATGTGHHHGATAQPATDQVPVRGDRLAAEQILDRHFLQLAGQRLPLQDVAQLGHGAERHAGAFADGDHPLHACGIQRGHGDHQQLGRSLADHRRGIIEAAQDRQALQLGAAQVRCVVQQADRFEVAGAAQIADQRLGGLPRTEDQHAARARIRLQCLVILPGPVQQARGAQQRRQRERIDHQHRHRHAVETLPHQHQHDADQADEAGLEDVQQVADAGETPQPAIQAHAPEHQALQQQHQGGVDIPERKRRRVGEDRVPPGVEQLPACPDHEQVVADDGRTRHQAEDSVPPG